MEADHSSSLFSLSIDPVTKSHLNDTARWARFLAISGIVLLGLAATVTVLSATIFPNSTFTRFTVNGVEEEQLTAGMKIVVAVCMLIAFLIAFFPMWYLLQFSNQMKKALYNNDQQALNHSFLNIKRYFRYVGIIMIIVLVVYGLAFILIGLGIAMR